ncbi:MAG: citrate (Si)-synthase [Salinivirgaceae bacterium]
MSQLKERLAQKIEEHRPRTTKLLKDHADVKLGEVTIGQALGGGRGVKMLVTDISYLDPMEGIRFRGFTIPEVLEKLPKAAGKEYPSIESFWWLLMTGDIPTQEEACAVRDEFNTKKIIPQYVIDLLRRIPRDTHPMTMFSMAILAMQRESRFAREYACGMNKLDYWKPMYEDAVEIMAKLPSIAAYIYRMKYRNDTLIPPDYTLDIGGNFAHMMGIDAPYDDVARLYFILHSDHESGNASAHTTHLVASTLSDAYYSLSAGLNALAGPLHGLATQEVLRWLQDVIKKLDGQEPTEALMKKFVWDTLQSGQVIPGFGHAVLRRTDPRYEAQRNFCLKHLPEDPLFKYVSMLYNVVPDILLEQGKAKNPWPNVDAQSGVLQWHYGIKEFDFYTVLFGVGRALGVLSNIIWDRALLYPLERPKSLTTAMLEEIAKKG